MEKCNKCGKLMAECNCEKKNEAPVEIDPAKAMIETPDGDVPLTAMVNAYNAAKKNEGETEEEKKKREDEESAKKNAEDEEAKKKAAEEAAKNGSGDGDEKKLTLEDEFEGVKVSDMYNAYKAKKNSDEEEAKKKAEAEAKEKENFNTLKNARDKESKEAQPESVMMSRSARIAAAKSGQEY